MYCIKCGKLLENDALFCQYCGEKRSIKTKNIEQNQVPNRRQYQAPNQGQYQVPKQGQYQVPNQGQYQVPNQGQYQVPNQGQYQVPNQGQYQVPNQGQYQVPNQGQYQVPNQGQYQAPNQGQYQAPNRVPNQAIGGNAPYIAREAGMAGVKLAETAVKGTGKAVKSGLKIKLLAVIALAVIAIGVMLYLQFFKSGTPEDTIEKLETALNDMDQKALMECFDSQMNSLYDGAMGIGSELIGFDLGAIVDLGSGLGGYFSAAGLIPTYDIVIKDIEYSSKESCVVTVDFVQTYQGETMVEPMVLPMVKVKREWLISMKGMDSLDFMY